MASFLDILGDTALHVGIKSVSKASQDETCNDGCIAFITTVFVVAIVVFFIKNKSVKSHRKKRR